MNKKNSSKKIKKYTTGGKINTYVENPSTALTENEILLAQAELEAANDPLVKGLDALSSIMGMAGNTIMGMNDKVLKKDFFKFGKGGTIHINPKNKGKFNTANWNKKDFGGEVPVEVEGGETARTPFGEHYNFEGPSHSEGGIDVSLPLGTEIFSDRISIDGKTMAQREKIRRNKEKKYQKRVDEGDFVSKKTLERVQKANAQEDRLDRTIQAIISKQDNQRMEDGGTVRNSLGSVPDPIKPLTWLQDWLNPTLNDFPNITATPITEIDYPNQDYSEGKNILKSILGSGTIGDIAGIVGNIGQAIEGKKGSQRVAATRTPNINPYQGFGEDALKANEQAIGFAQSLLSSQLQDLESSATSSRRNLRNTATGINTQRALDLAVEANKNKAERNVYDNFTKQLIDLFARKSDLENQQDARVMSGKAAQDLADRQDKAAVQSINTAANKELWEALSLTGGILNNMKERDTIGNLMNEIYQYTSFDPMSGKLTGKENSGFITSLIKNGGWKQVNNPDTGKPFPSLAAFKKHFNQK